MNAATSSPDLSSLAADYEIVGQLDSSGETRRYIATRKGATAKRRDDQAGVLIEVVTPPTGDEANALTHLAADTQLLARMPHRRILPIVEGRWIGKDAYAVVTQRTTDPSLAARLATREKFTSPRVAAILREVNGLLEWAREQKIVHRSITADRLFLEPKTDRVRVSFGIAPLRRIHHSDADDDARTIARLAMAMLTGEEDPQAYDGKTLAELRPDLPERLGEATGTLLDEKQPSTTADVAAYLALIGMAEPLRAGETERDRVRAEVLEEQRVEREKLAGERADFEREMADARERLEAERAELQRAVTAERAELQRALEAERATLTARHAELERAAAERLAEVERVAAQDRRRIEELREEIRRAGELEVEKKRQTALEDIVDTDSALDQDRFATPLFVPPMIAPLEQLQFDDDTPVMRNDEIVFAPLPDDTASPEVEEEPVAAGSSPTRRTWILSGAIAAVVAIAAASAIVLGSRHTVAAPAARPAPRATAAVPAAVAPAPAVPVTPPTLVADSAATVAAARWLDSLKAEHPIAVSQRVAAHEPTVRRADSGATPGAVSRAESSSASGSAPTSRRTTRDSAARRARSLTDSLFDIPGATTPVRSRPDTIPR
jgi:hypothetical protein